MTTDHPRRRAARGSLWLIDRYKSSSLRSLVYSSCMGAESQHEDPFDCSKMDNRNRSWSRPGGVAGGMRQRDIVTTGQYQH